MRGLQAWRRGNGKDTEDSLIEASGKLFGIWATFDLAEFYTLIPSVGKKHEDEVVAYSSEKRRGTFLVKGWFPGTIVLGWLYRASVAQAAGERDNAEAYSKRVLDHWGQPEPNFAAGS